LQSIYFLVTDLVPTSHTEQMDTGLDELTIVLIVLLIVVAFLVAVLILIATTNGKSARLPPATTASTSPTSLDAGKAKFQVCSSCIRANDDAKADAEAVAIANAAAPNSTADGEARAVLLHSNSFTRATAPDPATFNSILSRPRVYQTPGARDRYAGIARGRKGGNSVRRASSEIEVAFTGRKQCSCASTAESRHHPQGRDLHNNLHGTTESSKSNPKSAKSSKSLLLGPTKNL
jgi:hypothetical protein